MAKNQKLNPDSLNSGAPNGAGENSELLAKLLKGCTPVSTSSTNIKKFEKPGDTFDGFFKEIRPFEKNGDTWEKLVFLDVDKKEEWLLPDHASLRKAVEADGTCFYHIVFEKEETFGKKTKNIYTIQSNREATL